MTRWATTFLPQEFSEFIDRTWSPRAVDLFQRLETATKQITDTMMDHHYPPVNLIQEDSNVWVIELAVAGFTREMINIEVNNELLVITGQKPVDESRKDGEKFPLVIKQGIANRMFKSTFQLPEYVDSFTATMVNGILRITISRPNEINQPHVRNIKIE